MMANYNCTCRIQLILMEGHKDELLQYFSEEHRQFTQKYSKRLSIEQFKAQTPKQIKTQFQFLDSYDPNQNSDIRHKIPQIIEIRGDFMRSVINHQIYAIFCQAPSNWNAKHFWATCYREKVRKIFMLCTNSYEYWPNRNEERIFQNEKLTVRCLAEEQLNKVLIRRPIIITGPEGQLTLDHLHFTGWRDGGIPQGQECQQSFSIMVEEAIKLIENKQMIAVHCLAGIGRTGTFGAVVEAVRCVRLLKSVSLFEIVSNMRKDRSYCIERLSQYNFAHRQASILP